MAWVAKAGELYTRLSLRGDKAYASKIGKVIHRIRPLGQAMQRVARLARNLLIGGFGLGAMAVRSAMKFEHAMARIRAITNVTSKDFSKLSKIALQLGRSTVWTATQAAEAEEKLARAGFSVQEIIETLPATLNMATAAQMDLASAAQISSGVLRGMKLSTSQAREAMDVLAAAANSSNTEVSELGQGMRFVGPIAVQTGRSLQEVVAVMQALADVQIRGSMAGTSLRRILSALAGGSKPVVKFMKKYRVETEAASGQMRDLAEIIDDLNRAMVDESAMEKAGEIMLAFGQRAGPAMTELLSIGGDAIRDYQTVLEDAAGTSARMANIQLNTLQGAFTRLRSTVEGFTIRAGSKFTKMVREWTESLIAFVNVLHTMNEKELDQAISKTKTWVKVLAGIWIGTAIATAIAQIGMFVTSIVGGAAVLGGFKAAIATVGTAIAGMTAAIAAVVVMIAGLIAGIIIAYAEIRKAEKAQWSVRIAAQKEGAVLDQLTDAVKERDRAAEKGGKALAAALEREIQFRERLIELTERELQADKYLGEAGKERATMHIAFNRKQIASAREALKIAEKQAAQQELDAQAAKKRLSSLSMELEEKRLSKSDAIGKDLTNKFLGIADMWSSLSTAGASVEQQQLRTEQEIRDEMKQQTTILERLEAKAGGADDLGAGASVVTAVD